MKDLRVTLYSYRARDDDWDLRPNRGNRGKGCCLCDRLFREYVGFPDDCKRIDAVFSTTEPRGNDHFKLIRRAAYSSFWRCGAPAWLCQKKYVVADTKARIGYRIDAYETMADAYKKGYRFVWFEY